MSALGTLIEHGKKSLALCEQSLSALADLLGLLDRAAGEAREGWGDSPAGTNLAEHFNKARITVTGECADDIKRCHAQLEALINYAQQGPG